MEQKLNFESPSLIKRLKGMLSVDFYRLFHTPLFYIFLAISAIIPAMILGTTSIENLETGDTLKMYENAWQMIASDKPLFSEINIADYANMNMVFIFGGIMVSIFIGRDYKSGYVKQLFTTHAKKQDYMISKSVVCAFAMMSMCITYLLGTVASGLLVKADFSVDVLSLVISIISKMMLSFGWASLFTFINVISRRYFGISIISSFFFGTGILVLGIGALISNINIPGEVLTLFLYGSSSYACLSSTILTLLICALCSFGWFMIYNVLGTVVLSKSDVY